MRPKATSHDKIEAAALQLFRAQGFEETTASQIAAVAGVSERTFFRYFPDKKEILFDNEERVRSGLVSAIKAAPEGLGSLDVLFAAFHAFRTEMQSRREYVVPRQQVIDVTPALQERELTKIAALSDALAKALEERRVPKLEAMLAASAGMAAFTYATTEWVADDSIGFSERLSQARHSIAGMMSGCHKQE